MDHLWAHCRLRILCRTLLLLLLSLVLQLHQANAGSCNYFKGSWVSDSSFPLYNSTACPFIQKEFNCLKNGRPDQMYLNYRWQPLDCQLSRFGHMKLYHLLARCLPNGWQGMPFPVSSVGRLMSRNIETLSLYSVFAGKQINVETILRPTELERSLSFMTNFALLVDMPDELVDSFEQKLKKGGSKDSEVPPAMVEDKSNIAFTSHHPKEEKEAQPLQLDQTPSTATTDSDPCIKKFIEECFQSLEHKLDAKFDKLDAKCDKLDANFDKLLSMMADLQAKTNINLDASYSGANEKSGANFETDSHVSLAPPAEVNRGQYSERHSHVDLAPPTDVVRGQDDEGSSYVTPPSHGGRPARKKEPSAALMSHYIDTTKLMKFKKGDGSKFDPMRLLDKHKNAAFSRWLKGKDASISMKQ